MHIFRDTIQNMYGAEEWVQSEKFRLAACVRSAFKINHVLKRKEVWISNRSVSQLRPWRPKGTQGYSTTRFSNHYSYPTRKILLLDRVVSSNNFTFFVQSFKFSESGKVNLLCWTHISLPTTKSYNYSKVYLFVLWHSWAPSNVEGSHSGEFYSQFSSIWMYYPYPSFC